MNRAFAAERDRETSTSMLDVSRLPTFGFGSRSLMWWGTAGMILIEGSVFALTVATYFYLRSQATAWPMSEQPPALIWGTINTVIMLLSAIPNQWTKRAAERYDLRSVQVGMIVCLLFAVAFLVLRIFEFASLNCTWYSNAYGSVVWMLLGLHTVHLVTDFLDSAVLAALMFTKPLESKRYVDVAENAMYWYFVILSWIPIYAVIYWAARV